MKHRLFVVATMALALAIVLVGCDGSDTPTQEVIPTNDPQVLTEASFRDAIETACSNTITWWNTGDDSVSPDVPPEGVDGCVDDIVNYFCDQGSCKWVGPGADTWAYSKAHTAAEIAWTAAAESTDGNDYLGGNFVSHFKDELFALRNALGIPEH